MRSMICSTITVNCEGSINIYQMVTYKRVNSEQELLKGLDSSKQQKLCWSSKKKMGVGMREMQSQEVRYHKINKWEI